MGRLPKPPARLDAEARVFFTEFAKIAQANEVLSDRSVPILCLAAMHQANAFAAYKDIKKRGRCIEVAQGERVNPSVQILSSSTGCVIACLDRLGISPSKARSVDKVEEKKKERDANDPESLFEDV